MHLAVYCLRRLRARCPEQAVDLALVLATSVPEGLRPVLVLHFEVLFVVLGFGGKPFQVLVVIHGQGHGTALLLPPAFPSRVLVISTTYPEFGEQSIALFLSSP